MSSKREEAKAKKAEEEKQHNKVISDLIWYCTLQDLFDNVNDGKTEKKEIISDDEIYKYKTKVVHWIADKTDYNLEVSKKFISFAIQEYPNALFDLLKQGFAKNIKTIWWQYETKQKIAEKSKNFEKPDVEAKMENGESTSSFSNKKQIALKNENLGTSEVVASKRQTLREAWNDVNDVRSDVVQSGENLGNAKLAKMQAITSGAVNIANSTSNLLTSSMGALAAPKLIADLTNTVITETTSYVTDALKDMTLGCITYGMKYPSRVISLTTSYFKDFMSYYKVTLDDVMLSEESKAQLEREKSKSLEQKKIMDAKTQKLEESTAKINKVVSKVTNGMNNVAAYISEGPEWVEAQCTKLLFNGLSYVGKLRDITLDKVYNNLENKAHTVAYAAASEKFQNFDDEKKKAFKKQYEQIQVNAMKIQLKASQTVAVAKSKLIAKLGL